MSVGIFIVVMASVVFAGGVTLSVSRWLRRRAAARGAFAAVATELGIEHQDPFLERGRRLSGVIDGITVEVETQKAREMGASGFTRFRVEAKEEIPGSLRIRKRSLLPPLGAAIRPTGDQPFDEEIAVHGDEVLTAALLGPEARAGLLRFVAGHDAEISAGSISWEVNEAFNEAVDLLGYLRPMIELARRLSLRGRQPSSMLSFNARHDENPRVRQRNLELLGERFAEDPETRSANRRAAQDPDPVVRARGIEGLGDPAMIPRLRPLLAATEPEVIAAAARALGRLDDSGSAPALIALLARDDETVLPAVAGALARIGTISAVEPLLEAAQRPRLSGPAKRAARSAVGVIQIRLGNVEPGRLSLVDEELSADGAISLAGADGGLSLAEEGGELSLLDGADEPGKYL